MALAMAKNPKAPSVSQFGLTASKTTQYGSTETLDWQEPVLGLDLLGPLPGFIFDNLFRDQGGLGHDASGSDSEMEALRTDTSLASNLRMSSATRYRQQYLNLGRWKTHEGTRLAGEAQSFWTNPSKSALRWLVNQVESETPIELLDSLRRVLAKASETYPYEILQALEAADAASELQHTILGALYLRSKPIELPYSHQLRRILDSTLGQSNDVREDAYLASDALPDQLALDFLRSAQTTEQDDSLLELIEDQLQARSA